MGSGKGRLSSMGMGGSFALLTSLFFAWGFLTCMNDTLIPYFKSAFVLTYVEAMLIQFSFFIAYTIGSLAYFLISVRSGDPIARIGYQNGIVIGLLISGVGAFLFYPASILLSFPLFLVALFVLALGFTVLQISANPFVTILGPESSASSRLNLSQGFNSLGTTLAPLVGGALILNGTSGNSVEKVQIPYLIFAGSLALLAVIFKLIKLPSVAATEVKASAAVLKIPHLRFGMLAIFCYVGAEVSIGSLMISFLSQPDIAGMKESDGSNYLAIYWGGLMIGRFMGSISMSEKMGAAARFAGMALVAAAAFLVIYFAIYTKDSSFTWTDIAPFGGLILVNYLAFILGRSIASRTLAVFALFCVALLACVVFTKGEFAMWAVIGVGLFNSIMWSNIFSLSIERLGEYKSQASSLLVMMIMGGAVLPEIQGSIVDLAGMNWSYLLPMAAYLYLFWFGLAGYKIHPDTEKTLNATQKG